MRSEWVTDDYFNFVLMCLTPPNRLAVEMSARYGMRIGDVLATKTANVKRGRWTYKEEKTGKARRITLSKDFQARLLEQAGRFFVFEHRTKVLEHRTRQSVYKDIRRVAKLLRLKPHISPHSARKIYAVDKRKSGKSIAQIQRLLNHSSESVTLIYALADEMERDSAKKNQRLTNIK